MTKPWTLRLSVLGLAVACVAIGYVAGRPGAPVQSAPYLEQITRMLDLSPAQVVAIEATLAEESRAVDAMLTDQLAALREPVALRRAETEQALLEHLDVDQRALYHRLAEQEAEQR